MAWDKDLLEALQREADRRAEVVGTPLRADEAERPVFRSSPKMPRLIEITSAPPLRRVNGFGLGLYGWLKDPRLPAGHLKLYFLTALWLPILPVCAFAVDNMGGSFRFYHKLSLWEVIKAYRWRALGFYLTAFLEGAATLVFFVSLIAVVIYAVRWAFGRA